MAFAQTPVTFNEAMTMVEKRNERWRAADLAVNRARESRAEQRGLYWPTVGATGRYVHFNHELFVDLSPLHDLLSVLNPGATIPPLTATVLKNDPAKVVERQPTIAPVTGERPSYLGIGGMAVADAKVSTDTIVR